MPDKLAELSSPFTKIYDSWHTYAASSSKVTDDIAKVEAKCDISSYSSLLFVGMGGSATAGEIAASVLDGARIKCAVLKGSVLPDSVDKNTLVVASSVSGNTYETIQVVKSCQKRGIDVVTLSAGGELQRIAKNSGVPHITIQNLGAPRVSLPCLVYPVLNIVKAAEPGIERQIRSSLDAMSELAAAIASAVPTAGNDAKQLALFMKDVMPVCYYSASLKPAGIRFKNSLNENAKTQALVDDMEESCHNSIVPFEFEGKGRYGIIFLRNKDDDRMLARRFDAVRKYLSDKGIDGKEIRCQKDSLLANIMSAIYLLDYSSVYLAFLKGHDPSTTPAIDHVKSVMKD
jgi:glucose/mannose-6-phosphate isomerase